MQYDVVSLTQQLLRQDTINPPGREAEAMRFCAALLAEIGFSCRLVDHGNERSSLIAERGPKNGLWFSGHLDTVPLGRAAWSKPAFEGIIEGDRLYGRGSSDMKGGVAAFIAAAALAPTHHGVGIILTAGEETGCDGARWLAEAGALPQARRLIVGESTDNRALVGHKGVLWLKLSAKGRTAHGATPELGKNAIAMMTPTLGRLADFDPDFSHPQMGRSTANLGTIHAGINTNSVPDLCELTLDLRSVEGVTHQTLIAKVKNLCDDDIQLETLLDLPAVWSDPDDPWLVAARGIAERVTGPQTGPICANYFTDASVLKPAMGDPPVLILGPGSTDQPHSTDEYVRVSRLTEAVQIYSALMTEG